MLTPALNISLQNNHEGITRLLEEAGATRHERYQHAPRGVANGSPYARPGEFVSTQDVQNRGGRARYGILI